MACGCNAACGCQVVALDDSVTVQRIGDTFYVGSNVEMTMLGIPVFASETTPTYDDGPYLWIVLDEDGQVVTINFEDGT